MTSQDLKNQTCLVVIDGQFDFTDLPGAALPVKGGANALQNIGQALQQNPQDIGKVVLTQDWHKKTALTSAAAERIVDQDGVPVKGYTQVPWDMIVMSTNLGNKFKAADPNDQDWLLKSAEELSRRGGKEIMVWPEHCVENTRGAEFDDALMRGVAHWTSATGNFPVVHRKSLDSEREQYGAFGAEIPNRYTGEMEFDEELVHSILMRKRKLWGGLARGHCLAASFDQTMSREDPENYHTHVILSDGTADVTGFEDFGEAWMRGWQEKGVQVMTVAEAFALKKVAA